MVSGAAAIFALAHQVQPRQRRHGAPVVAVHAKAPATRIEVQLRQPRQLSVRKDGQPEIRIGAGVKGVGQAGREVVAHHVDEDQALGGRNGLVGVGGHPEAEVSGRLAWAQWRLAPQKVPGRGDARIQRPVFGRRLLHGHQGHETRRLIFAVAKDDDIVRLACQPMLGQGNRRFSLVPSHHGYKRRNVIFTEAVGHRAAAGLPFEEGPHHGIIAMQVDEVEQGELLLRSLGCLEPLRVEHAGPAMQFGIPFGVAPAQVRDQRLARQVVREQARLAASG